MTPRPTEADQSGDRNLPAGPSSKGSPVNPNLSANLNADYEALQNDMQQAKDLAADFQRQLAGKSNEFAQLKQLFEKTAEDLAHLQEGIVELRAERHRLANESMRATAFQHKLVQVTAERDRLRVDMEHVRRALQQSADEMAAAVRDRDSQIAGLVIELVTLKESLEVARREAASARVTPPANRQANDEAAPKIPTQQTAKGGAAEDFIDISFGT